MSKLSSNEIWVFLSHSNKDYEKVRLVRNMLETQGMRPLMFFLNCLNDEDEIDSLIKREIDCRTRFILCDSENAKASKWVQNEVEYIKSRNRIYEIVDINKDIEEISAALRDFVTESKIFISYNRETYQLAEMVSRRLQNYDFSVYIDKFWAPEEVYDQNYTDTLGFLSDSIKDGYVLSIMSARILQHTSSSRYELIKAIDKNKSLRSGLPNIIPFVISDDILEYVLKDEKLSALGQCGIQSLAGLSLEQQCDEIIRRVVTQLMTPGSIEVQAENFAKGVNCDRNEREAEFLRKILKSS